MRIKLNAMWFRSPWPMTTWDAAYALLTRAGAGDAAAAQEVANIKTAAKVDAKAAQVKTNFDAVAKLIIKGLPRPSQFAAQRRGGSPLRRGAAPGRATPAQAALIKKQQDQINALKRQQVERAAKDRMRHQAQQRVAAVKSEAEAQQQEIEAQLEMLKKQLERRELDDEIRRQLEAQAEQYEGLLEAAKRGGPVATTEAVVAEEAEAQQDDAAEAYDSGAPGDVEYNDAGV